MIPSNNNKDIMLGNGTLPVLLAEDAIDDKIITKRFWEKTRIKNPLIFVSDGEEALDFLHKRNNYENAPDVCLIFLDYYMPKLGGLEVLKDLYKSGVLSDVPKIILSGGKENSIISEAQSYGCSGFIEKPLSYENCILYLIENNIIEIKHQ